MSSLGRVARNHRLRWLTSGQFVSGIGDGIFVAALPWFVLAEYGSATLGFVMGAYGLPRAGLIVVGGHLADRFGPARMMVLSDVIRAICTALLASIAIYSKQPPGVTIIILIVVGIGLGEALFLPASFSLMPTLVDDKDLTAGNAALATSARLAGFIGPPTGGLLLGATGAGFAFLLNAFTFVVSAAALWRVAALSQGGDKPVVNSHDPVDAEMSSLRSVVRAQPVIRFLFVVFLAGSIVISAIDTVGLPAFTRDILLAGATSYGALLLAMSVGELLGSLAAVRLPAVVRPNMLTGMLFGVGGIGIVGLSQAASTLVAGSWLLVCGIALAYGNLLSQTALQRWSPPHLRGALTGILLSASFGALPVSAMVAGLATDSYGVEVYLVAAGAVFVVIQVFALLNSRFRDFGMQRGSVPTS
ncbi:MAG: MFS transporter [Nocardioides sp.]